MSLDFDTLREKNVARSSDVFGHIDDWTPTDWATAVAGECGEMCNEIKKMRRIATSPEELAAIGGNDQWTQRDYEYSRRISNVANELADMITYADLLAARLGIDLGKAVIRKFNDVSNRKGSAIRLPDDQERE